jgi:hypothetical protein
MCRFTYYGVHLVHFEVSKISYIYKQREYHLSTHNYYYHENKMQSSPGVSIVLQDKWTRILFSKTE